MIPIYLMESTMSHWSMCIGVLFNHLRGRGIDGHQHFEISLSSHSLRCGALVHVASTSLGLRDVRAPKTRYGVECSVDDVEDDSPWNVVPPLSRCRFHKLHPLGSGSHPKVSRLGDPGE